MAQTDSSSTEFPLLYAAWLDEWLGGPLPVEVNATCSNCAMLPPSTDPELRANHYFNPNSKCCTYLPTLPNFLVGSILADEQVEMTQGRETTQTRLQSFETANPLWLEKSPAYDFKYRNLGPFFGQLDDMVCPHYIDDQGGLCSIWKYRNSVCSTWYCKHTRGDVGQHFWFSLRDLFIALESDLAKWCALELHIPLESLKALRNKHARDKTVRQQEIEQTLPDRANATYKKIWGNWDGRQTEFYIECARLVENLSWSEVLAICGPDVNALYQLVLKTYTQHQSDLVPERLQLGDYTVVSMQAEYNLVASYLAYDLLKVPRSVLDLLPYFDGRPTQEVLADFTQNTDLEINPSLVRKLVDFKILVPVDGYVGIPCREV